MKTSQMPIALIVAALLALPAGHARAHCDTASGPVIQEARAALASGEIAPILKWIKADHEAEVRDAFEKAVTVRTKGPEAQELADHYFIETLVRLHRAGEGAAYTGIKEEPAEPIVALADQALAAGSPEDMIQKLSGHLAQAVREKHHRVMEAARHKDESVEAGRAYVEAYVIYMHFVEGIHAAILSGGGHHHEAAAENPAEPAGGHEKHGH